MTSVWGWIGFNVVVLTLIVVDLLVFHRRPRHVSLKEAGAWSALWVGLSLTFSLFVFRFMGTTSGLEFLAGYLIEYALSVDNIFVFVLIFGYFRIPMEYQHRVLLWGIMGALILRGAMIGAGSVLVSRFEWILYIFGAFLVFTGIRMALQKAEDQYDPEDNPVLRLVRKVIPVTPEYHGQQFFVRAADASGHMRLMATPLFIVLVLVETTDVIFATDSIPAIFAITRDPFIVYTSNVCAVLGLRALYFLLAGIVDKFHYLKIGLSVVLIFIGLKMLGESFVHVPIAVSLGVVALILVVSVFASLRWPREDVPTIPPLATLGQHHQEREAAPRERK